ncbi:unnamed protein product, partial [Urochloa humidicola]
LISSATSFSPSLSLNPAAATVVSRRCRIPPPQPPYPAASLSPSAYVLIPNPRWRVRGQRDPDLGARSVESARRHAAPSSSAAIATASRTGSGGSAPLDGNGLGTRTPSRRALRSGPACFEVRSGATPRVFEKGHRHPGQGVPGGFSMKCLQGAWCWGVGASSAVGELDQIIVTAGQVLEGMVVTTVVRQSTGCVMLHRKENAQPLTSLTGWCSFIIIFWLCYSYCR